MGHKAGAAFIGMGGTCAKNVKHRTYGEFNMLPQKHHLLLFHSMIGSMGNKKQKMSGGGGRIIVKADSIDFATAGPKLQADGFPLDVYKNESIRELQGGSGGYIYLATHNLKQPNNYHTNSRISAVGGHGLGNSGAGSGGVIVLGGNITLAADEKSEEAHKLNIDSSGGVSDYKPKAGYNEGCANGAAGTIWFKKDDILIVDNKWKRSDKFTRMEAPTYHQKLNEPHLIAKSVMLKGHAKGAVIGEHHWMAFDNLYLGHNVTMTLDRERYMFKVQLRQNVDLHPTSTIDLS